MTFPEDTDDDRSPRALEVSMPFVKLDTGMLDSSLWIDREAREVFITALLMAEPFEHKEPTAQLQVRALDETGFVVPPGWYGIVRAAGTGIVGRSRLEREEGLAALERLGAADPDSRSAEFDGRRLVRVDGGYLVLNYFRYRERDYGAAERMRKLRAKRAAEACVTPNSCNVPPNVTHAEAEAEKEKNTRPTARTRGPLPVLHEQIISAYHELLPSLPVVKAWPERRRKKLSARISERVAEGKPADTVEYWRQLFGKVAASDFLMGRAKDWRCPGLEWLAEPKNFTKVIEGAYDNPRREHGIR